jgi:assimilatory nitrate reductase catalytic subunit
MTRTGGVARLMAHTPEPLLALHPEDAIELGLNEGDPAEIATAHGRMVLQIACEPGQRRGEVFGAMHWTDRFSSAGPIARLVSGVTDPVSGQPELKATGATITPLLAHWRGLLLTLADSPPPGLWTRVPAGAPAEAGALFRLIGLDPLPESAEAFAANLLGAPEGAEILVLGDPARQVLRLAALDDGRLVGFLALGPDRASLPPVEWLGGLLGTIVPEATRLLLLAGRAPGAAAASGAALCACFGVHRAELVRAVAAEGLDSVAAVGRHLRAGTGCGSCIPEIREVLRDVHRRAA